MKKFSIIAAAIMFIGQNAVANPVIIDINQAMQPIGNLKINGENASGYISGINIDNSAVAVDDYNRGFSVNLTSNQHAYNTFNSTTDLSGIRFIANADYGDVLIVVNPNLQEWTAMSRLIDSPIKYDVYLKTRKQNPFMHFNGVYGSMKLSTIMDNVFTYDYGKIQAKIGIMFAHTSFEQGIIKNIDNQIGSWGELSYTDSKFTIATGVYPTSIRGKVHMEYPDEQNNQTGELNYTSQNFNTTSKVQNYIRAEYEFKMGAGNVSFGIYAKNADNWKNVNTYQSIAYTVSF